MKKKQKKNINTNNVFTKEKINERNNGKEHKLASPDINIIIQNIRNKAVEQMKLISKPNNYNLKPMNTESIFGSKKINNYQPISSKVNNNNSNPFRNSSKGFKENLNIGKNFPSGKKQFISYASSNSTNSFLNKEKNKSKNKAREGLNYMNISETGKNKSRQKDNVILKNKYLYNIVEKSINIEDNSLNKSDIKNKEIQFEDKFNKYIHQYDNKNSNRSMPKKKKKKSQNQRILEKI